MNQSMNAILDVPALQEVLHANHHAEPGAIREILSKAKELHGLTVQEVAVLMAVQDPDGWQAIFEAARFVKEAIYGRRLVIFAPLYISNVCSNECAYCAFRVSNRALPRRSLTQDEIALEVRALIDQGHKRVLLEAGEDAVQNSVSYLMQSIETIYQTTTIAGAIRRVNVNVVPLDVDGFKQLKAANIGTYQLFQETYDKNVYQAMHLSGKKRDYDWRLTAMDRAMQAGIDDVGVGVLFGLAPWRFEVLALLQHAEHLQSQYGVGPHTISVPRLKPAHGAPVSHRPPHSVSDEDFERLVAILRLAVPYTGIILSTRESIDMRRRLLSLGVSQISAGSRTNPGGYGQNPTAGEQFSVGDERSLDDVIRDVVEMGCIPSFCTACYRLGRTGEAFMALAKPGAIKTWCQPNALLTFAEYLQDFASPITRQAGQTLLKRELAYLAEDERARMQQLLDRLSDGEQDIFV